MYTYTRNKNYTFCECECKCLLTAVALWKDQVALPALETKNASGGKRLQQKIDTIKASWLHAV